MRFTIPDKVQVGGVDFPVIYEKGLGRNDHRRGETQYFDRRITIDPDLSLLDGEATFLHEVLHAIDNTYDCDLKESQVHRIAQGFHQVLRQLEATYVPSQVQGTATLHGSGTFKEEGGQSDPNGHEHEATQTLRIDPAQGLAKE